MYKISLSLLSLFSLAVSSNTNNNTNDAPLRAALLFSSSLFLCFYIYTRNEYKNTTRMERFCFPPRWLSTRPVCMNKRTRRSLLFSVQRTKKRTTLRGTETAPFCTERSTTRSTLVQTYTLNACLFTLSSCGDIFSPLQSAQHTHYYNTTIIMAGEEETETFAFQAEINQLLSLIINVRTFFMRCTSFSFQRVEYSFPAQIVF